MKTLMFLLASCLVIACLAGSLTNPGIRIAASEARSIVGGCELSDSVTECNMHDDDGGCMSVSCYLPKPGSGNVKLEGEESCGGSCGIYYDDLVFCEIAP